MWKLCGYYGSNQQNRQGYVGVLCSLDFLFFSFSEAVLYPARRRAHWFFKIYNQISPLMCKIVKKRGKHKVVFQDHNLSCLMTKPTKWLCAQWRLRSAWASAQSGQSLLSAWRKLWSLTTHLAHSEDSDRLGRCPGWYKSLLGTILLVLSWGGSIFHGQRYDKDKIIVPLHDKVLCYCVA